MANINQYVEEANVFFKKVAAELGNPEDTAHAARVTTAFFHALRERITPEQSMHIISQLPMILKGIYVDGWKMTREPNDSKTMREFLDEVREHSLRSAGRDFGNDQQARENLSAVLRVLKNYVSEGEMNDIRAQLPQPLAEMFE